MPVCQRFDVFPAAQLEYSVRIMGYDVSPRRIVIVFKGRNFQEELHSSMPEDDITVPQNVPIRITQ